MPSSATLGRRGNVFWIHLKHLECIHLIGYTFKNGYTRWSNCSRWEWWRWTSEVRSFFKLFKKKLQKTNYIWKPPKKHHLIFERSLTKYEYIYLFSPAPIMSIVALSNLFIEFPEMSRLISIFRVATAGGSDVSLDLGIRSSCSLSSRPVKAAGSRVTMGLSERSRTLMS